MKIINLLKRVFLNPFVSQFLFWGWNIIYILSFLTLEFNEQVFSHMLNDAFIGEMPLSILLYGLVLVLAPVLSIVVAIKYLQNKSMHLLRWFVCVQLPIMFLAFIRLVGFNEITWGNAHFITIALLGIGTMMYFVLNETHFLSTKWKELKLIGLTSILLLISYVSLILLMIIFPLAVIFLKEFITFDWIHDFFDWNDLGWFIILFLFAIISGALFVVYPFYAFILYLQTFKKAFFTFIKENASLTWAIVLVGVTVNIALFFALNFTQPQEYVFELWDRMEQHNSSELKNEFYQNESKIKRGIMNAYLANYRYAFDSSDRPLGDLYDEAFNSEKATDFASTITRGLAFPFMYQGNMYSDEEKARELYGMWFDESLHIAEQKRIVKAINSTWNREDVEAGILDINEKKVLVKQQDVSIQETGNFAEIEVHEVYQNQTFNQQEILYYFSMPPNAVFSGMWLSDNDSVSKKYDFNVAPRGAAQQVYKDEVRRRVDPSLLEQVGPNQYRLRAFPILPKTRDYNNSFNRRAIIEAPNFHLWLQYTICNLDRTRDATWGTPEVLERRNVFANKHTTYSFNGKVMEVSNDRNWVPYEIKKTTKSGGVSEVSFNGENVIFRTMSDKYELRKQPVNVLIDNSYSMQKHLNVILRDLSTLQDTLGKQNVRIAIGKKRISAFSQLRKNDFWGKEQAMQQLSKYADTFSSSPTIFITDKGSYELLTDEVPAIKLQAPLFIYHLDKLAKAYPDNLFETIKMNDGSSCTNTSDILDQLSYLQMGKKQDIGRYTILSMENKMEISFFEGSKKPSILYPSPKAGKIIASKIIDKKVTDLYTGDRLKTLDQMHEIAKKYNIVSPYSSMIVLVNDAQKDALKRAEEQDDRFDRENETGDEPDGVLGLTNVTGTPEPHEWVLIIISCLLLLLYTFRKNQWMQLGRKM